jgi:hypothetical protein
LCATCTKFSDIAHASNFNANVGGWLELYAIGGCVANKVAIVIFILINDKSKCRLLFSPSKAACTLLSDRLPNHPRFIIHQQIITKFNKTLASHCLFALSFQLLFPYTNPASNST